MKKIELKLDLHDNKAKRKALKTVATLSGIDLIAMDMKEKKLTVVGIADPITLVAKLRKQWPATGIISVGPAKEPEKKEEPKKEGEDGKKEEPKKEEEAKKEGEKTEEKKEQLDLVWELIKANRAYNPYSMRYHYVPSMEENPNACVIC